MATQSIPSGSITVFRTATAPTNWTKTTTLDDAAIRIVTTGTGSWLSRSGFTSIFANSRTITGTINPVAPYTVGPYALSTPQISAHTHDLGRTTGSISGTPILNYWAPYRPGGGTPTRNIIGAPAPLTYPTFANNANPYTSLSSGGGEPHTHDGSPSTPTAAVPFSGTYNFALKYVDMIRCQRN
jgi:hypothetical protein